MYLLKTLCVACSLAICFMHSAWAQDQGNSREEYIRAHYTKFEYQVPMRDGTRLFTIVYLPNDATAAKRYPVLLMRTPYSIGPYGADQYRRSLGPNQAFEESGYIFAFQDVRGCYMSEGDYVNMRPQQPEKTGTQFDESSDTYDTIEWLSHKLDCDNARFGMWGISYPGFYTAAGAIDSHPALKCVSPQAPIGDWFWDDMHRNGAFNVQLAVTFFSSFGQVRETPTSKRGERLDLGTDDSYQFFLELGSLANVNERHFHEKIPFWNEVCEHPNYDYFWQSRNLIPHLRNVRCASLVVGGWFDTEDLYGPLRIYDAIEKNNPQVQNNLVMGPWYHGGWNQAAGDELGDASFDWPTAEWYRKQVEFPFFEHHLKGQDAPALSEATVFETGANRWRHFDSWPPRNAELTQLYLSKDGTLQHDPPAEITEGPAVDSYVSDPRKPVPYTTEITSRWSRNYMVEDQRFAARRPDVLVYHTEPLDQDVTIAGPLKAEIWFSTNRSAADVVVKLIDEFPGRSPSGDDDGFPSGRQQLVRGQVMRARFRDGFEHPKPLVPNQPEKIEFELHDVLHTFKRGHRIMVQVQSTWFPFVDRNPQNYVANIFSASDDDFESATHTIYRSPQMPSLIRFTTIDY
ncbi:MAG: CocE/NonD family hydrolase [Planctomycetales bacterium]|nr:CocE/NonD family hydrolase [Planctomycetales bacterium]